jgi:tetratricopeptide (TPR) repeat protein
VGRSANIEAIAILNKAVAALDLVPDRARLRDQEFAILTTLAAALSATKGYGDPETKNTYMKARELSVEIGDVERKLPALFGVWANFYATGQHKESWKSLHEFIRIGKDHNSEDFNSVSQWMLIQELFTEGKFKEAANVYEERLQYGIGVNDDKLALEIGEHPGALTSTVASWSYLFLGNIDQSIKSLAEGIKLSNASNHANSIAVNMFYESALHKELGNNEKSYSTAVDCMAYAEKQEIPAWVAWARVLKGVAECHIHRGNDSIASIRQGLADWQHMYSLYLPQLNVYLAEACLVAGRYEEGLGAVEEGSERAIEFEERAADAELHRVRGELLAASGRSSPEEVEISFRAALDIARKQQAKTFELRAATSLARLWSDRGDRQRARDLLAPIYGWFTDGFGTRDLIEAKALLDAIG